MKHLRAAWAQLVSNALWALHKRGFVTEDTAEWYYGQYLVLKLIAADGLDVNEHILNQQQVTWSCQHMTVSGNIVGKPTAYCGCDLQPSSNV